VRIPIRWRLLGLLWAVLLAALVSYVVLATRLMTADRMANAHDLNANVARAAAEEVRTVLEARRDGLALLAGAASPDQVADDLLAHDGDLLRVVIYRRSPDGVWSVAFERADAARLEPLSVTLADLAQLDEDLPPPLDEAAATGLGVMNRSLPPRAPLLLVASGAPGVVATADLRPDRLLRIFTRGDLQRGYLVDDAGRVIADAAPDAVLHRAVVADRPIVNAAVKGELDAGALEFADPGGKAIIGAFARVAGARLIALSEIDLDTALASSRELVRRSILFGVAILCLAVVASLFFARRLTTPIRRLRDAAAELEKGRYDADPGVRSRDEIGDLAAAFRKMAIGLRDAQAQIVHAEKLATFGQIGAGITHEVKNPLTGIISFAQIGRRVGVAKPDKAMECFSNIEAEAKRCNQIVDSLLKFARPEAMTEREVVDVNEVVSSTWQLMKHQVKTSGSQLVAAPAPGALRVLASPGQIQQVLMNLVLNAAQALEGREGGEVRLETRARADGRVEIACCDDGPGIPVEVQARVMEPFFSTKPKGKGTGLGLSVSREIVRAHGGELVLESTLGRGTTMRVVLPAHDASAADAPPPSGVWPAVT
jgi:two-component system NtrC family sensor kinase